MIGDAVVADALTDASSAMQDSRSGRAGAAMCHPAAAQSVGAGGWSSLRDRHDRPANADAASAASALSGTIDQHQVHDGQGQASHSPSKQLRMSMEHTRPARCA